MQKIHGSTSPRATLRIGFGLCIGLAVLTGCGKDPSAQAKPPTPPASDSVTINDQQARHVTVEPVQLRNFDQHRDAVGFIDFNQDRLAQVFPAYQGRVRQVLAKLGDDVTKGQVLFTIDSPDLAQAESNLIATAGVRELTTRTLGRARQMLDVQASAQKDVEQATSDQQAAEGNYRSARNVLRLQGMTDGDIDRIVASHKVDGELRVLSPMAGRVTARTVAPGDFVQPGGATAPFTVANLDSLWMVANVAEDDAMALRAGQTVTVAVNALPGRTLQGTIEVVGSSVDPATHRVQVRSTIHDTRRELRPQMLATFVIRTGEPLRSAAVPANAVVREGDGTMTVYTTQDGHRFTRRPVKLGLQQDGFNQIVEGLSGSERVAGDGALFISNALALQSQ
ncbi:efflux RND transporter periplasmic adaptor subunit [Dyella subtropica]|uniref:efflux RND transporter periplasmic adaptor subunit n=1 Tax=Dyella subtropica TaxID=2992127 RepID=UPI00224E9E47|nr:efflux RND transporter periplasmic adaptor subunit [Dyella subtropica]